MGDPSRQSYADFRVEPEEHRRRVYHEAGHAVVGVARGARLKYIAANPNYDGDYAVSLAFDLPNLMAFVATRYAGALGDWLGLGNLEKPPWFEDDPRGWRGAGDDALRIEREIATALPDAPAEIVEDFRRQAREDAWNVLAANVRALHALVEACVGVRETDGPDALAIVELLLVLP